MYVTTQITVFYNDAEPRFFHLFFDYPNPSCAVKNKNFSTLVCFIMSILCSLCRLWKAKYILKGRRLHWTYGRIKQKSGSENYIYYFWIIKIENTTIYFLPSSPGSPLKLSPGGPSFPGRPSVPGEPGNPRKPPGPRLPGFPKVTITAKNQVTNLGVDLRHYDC